MKLNNEWVKEYVIHINKDEFISYVRNHKINLLLGKNRYKSISELEDEFFNIKSIKQDKTK